MFLCSVVFKDGYFDLHEVWCDVHEVDDPQKPIAEDAGTSAGRQSVSWLPVLGYGHTVDFGDLIEVEIQPEREWVFVS